MSGSHVTRDLLRQQEEIREDSKLKKIVNMRLKVCWVRGEEGGR